MFGHRVCVCARITSVRRRTSLQPHAPQARRPHGARRAAGATAVGREPKPGGQGESSFQGGRGYLGPAPEETEPTPTTYFVGTSPEEVEPGAVLEQPSPGLVRRVPGEIRSKWKVRRKLPASRSEPACTACFSIVAIVVDLINSPGPRPVVPRRLLGFRRARPKPSGNCPRALWRNSSQEIVSRLCSNLCVWLPLDPALGDQAQMPTESWQGGAFPYSWRSSRARRKHLWLFEISSLRCLRDLPRCRAHGCRTGPTACHSWSNPAQVRLNPAQLRSSPTLRFGQTKPGFARKQTSAEAMPNPVAALGRTRPNFGRIWPRFGLNDTRSDRSHYSWPKFVRETAADLVGATTPHRVGMAYIKFC